MALIIIYLCIKSYPFASKFMVDMHDSVLKNSCHNREVTPSYVPNITFKNDYQHRSVKVIYVYYMAM